MNYCFTSLKKLLILMVIFVMSLLSACGGGGGGGSSSSTSASVDSSTLSKDLPLITIDNSGQIPVFNKNGFTTTQVFVTNYSDKTISGITFSISQDGQKAGSSSASVDMTHCKEINASSFCALNFTTPTLSAANLSGSVNLTATYLVDGVQKSFTQKIAYGYVELNNLGIYATEPAHLSGFGYSVGYATIYAFAGGLNQTYMVNSMSFSGGNILTNNIAKSYIPSQMVYPIRVSAKTQSEDITSLFSISATLLITNNDGNQTPSTSPDNSYNQDTPVIVIGNDQNGSNTNPSSPTNDKESPPTEDKESPPMEDKESPPMEDKESPPMEDKESPPTEDKESPPMEDKESPPTEDKESPPTEDAIGIPGLNGDAVTYLDTIKSNGSFITLVANGTANTKITSISVVPLSQIASSSGTLNINNHQSDSCIVGQNLEIGGSCRVYYQVNGLSGSSNIQVTYTHATVNSTDIFTYKHTINWSAGSPVLYISHSGTAVFNKGEHSGVMVLKLENVSQLPIYFNSVTYSGLPSEAKLELKAFDSPCVKNLALKPGGICTYSFAINNINSPQNGDINFVFNVIDDAGTYTAAYPISYVVTNYMPLLTISPDVLSFAGQVGSQSEIKKFTVKNEGTWAADNVNFSSLTSPLSILDNSCSASIPKGQSCTISVKLDVANVTPNATQAIRVEYGNSQSVTSNINYEVKAKPLAKLDIKSDSQSINLLGDGRDTKVITYTVTNVGSQVAEIQNKDVILAKSNVTVLSANGQCYAGLRLITNGKCTDTITISSKGVKTTSVDDMVKYNLGYFSIDNNTDVIPATSETQVNITGYFALLKNITPIDKMLILNNGYDKAQISFDIENIGNAPADYSPSPMFSDPIEKATFVGCNRVIQPGDKCKLNLLSTHTNGASKIGTANVQMDYKILDTGIHSILNLAIPYSITGGFTKIVAGEHHACGLSKDGVVYCWGRNNYGQLGIGNLDDHAVVPTRIVMPLGVQFQGISAGGNNTCAIEGYPLPGVLYCWGDNTYVQLAKPLNVFRVSPVPVAILNGNTPFLATQVSVGGLHICAISDTKIAYCWGDNIFGQLGNGSKTHLPVSISSIPVELINQHITSISAGYYHTCATLYLLDAVECWGRNDRHQVFRSEDQQIFRMDGSHSVGFPGYEDHISKSIKISSIKVSAGYNKSCAYVNYTDNTTELFCWGDNAYGSLGVDSYRTDLNEIYRVFNGEFPGFGASLGLGEFFSVAIYDKIVYTWGANNYGQLGQAITDTSHTEKQPAAASLSQGFDSVTAGRNFACALSKLVPYVYCWGDNTYGQLGNSTSGGYSNIPKPAQAGN